MATPQDRPSAERATIEKVMTETLSAPVVRDVPDERGMDRSNRDR
jgi:hypothetical protein